MRFTASIVFGGGGGGGGGASDSVDDVFDE